MVAKIQVGELREVVDPPVLGEGLGVMASVEPVEELAFRCVALDKDDQEQLRPVWVEARGVGGEGEPRRRRRCTASVAEASRSAGQARGVGAWRQPASGQGDLGPSRQQFTLPNLAPA